MSFFKKSPADKLRKEYESLRRQAMEAQRGGDIVKCSELSAQADDLLKKIEDGS